MDTKDKINELRQKLELKKTQLQAEKEIKEEHDRIEETLLQTTFDVYQDKTKKGRHFLIAKIKYNPETLEAAVVEVREFGDKTAGLAFVMDKDNRNYLYNKSKRRDK